jgi:transposase-like protein
VPRPPFPRTLREFQWKFATEEACQEYLAACRWPDGFVCPRCGNRRAYEMAKLRRWQCTCCRHQASLTAETILHNTKTPLTVWFWAAYLMTTDKRGISALLLQRQLDLRRYETAWMMLHKFRRAMINVAREPLRGEVEVDDTWVGGTQAGLRGSRQLKGRKAALVLVAVEKRGRATGRARMGVIPDFKRGTLIAFLKQNVAAGSTLYTDGLKSFTGLQEAGFQHVPRSQPLRIDLRKGARSVVPLADRAIGNLQQWLI